MGALFSFQRNDGGAFRAFLCVGGWWRALLGQLVDLAHNQEDGEGDDQKIKHRLDEIAVGKKRRAGFPRCNRGDDLYGNDFALSAESAANQRLDYANLLHRHFQHEREFVLQVVRDLRR